MDYKPLRQPDLSIEGQAGLCLAYVTDVFGAAGKYPTAINAWDDAQYRHAGATPPANVAVPVWFSYNGPDGHVAVWVPGKGIYSTSAQGDKVFASIEAIISWMGEGFAYLGWSEDINEVRVVEEVAVPAPAAGPTVKPPAAPPEKTNIPVNEVVPPPAPEPSYTVHADIPGYPTSNDAANHINSNVSVAAGTNYHVFNESNGMVNVTTVQGEAGAWINPADNVEPKPEPPAPEKPANIVYTRLAEPLTLVTNKQPTHKWALDFPNDTEAKSVATLDQGATFVAVGKGQRTDHDRPCYFMEAADFGEADKTGVPTNNYGINTVDLSEPPKSEALKSTLAVSSANSGTVSPVIATSTSAPSTPPPSWQASYTGFLSPVEYKATASLIIEDLADQQPNAQLIEGDPKSIAGIFNGPDGSKYYRTETSVQQGSWYGIPVTAMVRVTPMSDAEVDNTINQLANEPEPVSKTKTAAIAAAGTADGFVSRLFHKKKG